MQGFITVAIAGITTIVASYLLINYASNAKQVSGQFTSSYGQVAKTFAGR